MKRLFCLATTILLLLPPNSEAGPKTVSVLTVGNSFAGNALTYLPDLAERAGHSLVVGRANLGGCSLERHWKHAAAFEADPKSKAGSPYEGGKKSLSDLLKSQQWDFITIQQLSIKSHDLSTYQPFARKLIEYIRERAPGSEILVHQTWAYRVDDPRFSPSDGKEGPKTQKEMYEQVRHAYHTLAEELDLGIVPSGDAMYLADSDPKWGFRPDPNFDSKKIVYPDTPKQEHSLHSGWIWRKARKNGRRTLRMDGHHASAAGCFLIGATWFEVLFAESVVENPFVPEGIEMEYANFLKKTAHRAVKQSKALQ